MREKPIDTLLAGGCRAGLLICTCFGGALAVVPPAYGDVQPIVDLLTPNGFGINNDNNSGAPASDFPPVGLVTLDLYVSVTPGDEWETAGIAVHLTTALATIEYFLDPNGPVLTAPESAGSPSRHVSFVSEVRGRELSSRFRSPAVLHGPWDPPTQPQADGMNFNLAFSEPAFPEEEDEGSGFVGRVSIDVSQVLADRQLGPDDLFLGPPAQGFPPVADIAFAAASQLNPTGRRIDLTLYAVPEPAALAFFLVACTLVARWRRHA